MTQSEAMTLLKEAIWLILKLSAPLLIVSIVIGLVVSIFQAATQIHEQTLTFVPKIVAIAILLIILGSWMLTNMTDFFQSIMIEDEFGHEENNGASSHILLIPEVDGLKKIMESLGLDTW